MLLNIFSNKKIMFLNFYLNVDHCIQTVKNGRCFFLPVTHCTFTSLYFNYMLHFQLKPKSALLHTVLNHSTFPFSCIVHLCSLLRSRSTFTMHSLCIQLVLTVHLSFSQIIFWRITVHTCSLFLIFFLNTNDTQ